MELRPDLKHMIAKKAALDAEIEGMSKLFRYRGFADLSEAEKAGMEKQFRAMQDYSEALEDRIGALSAMAV